MIFHALQNAGILALLSLVVVVIPLVMGIVYAIRPTEARLALMRPLSLASIFAALTGFCTGLINALMGAAAITAPLPDGTAFNYPVFVVGLAEGLIPLFAGFGCLTIAWLCVALGMRR